MAFSHRRVRLHQLVEEGRAEVAREQERSVALPYHHYWLDERIETYERRMRWARRLVYLTLRAVEYDIQQSLALRDDVLNAKNPVQLAIALQHINTELLEYRVGPRNARPQGRVLEVTMRQILGIPPSDTTSFGQLLAGPAAPIYDVNGEYIGRGFRFQITPTSAFLLGSQITTDCAQRLTSFTGSVQLTGGTTLTRVPFVLMQANTFSSAECVASDWLGEVPLVTASHRPAQNLFDEDGNGMSSFAEITRRTPATVSNFPDLAPEQLAGGDTQAVNTDFAGRGVYGDYIFLIRKDVLGHLNLSNVTDVLIRFDFTGVENGTTAN
jgi:hypothetical protein